MISNAIRTRGFVRAIEAREIGDLANLIESLRRMPGDEAHDILDQADAILAAPDRHFFETFLEYFAGMARAPRQAPDRMSCRF